MSPALHFAAFAVVWIFGFAIGRYRRRRTEQPLFKAEISYYWCERMEEALQEYEAAIDACPDPGGYQGSLVNKVAQDRVVFAYFHHLRNRRDAGLPDTAIPFIIDWKRLHVAVLGQFRQELFGLELDRLEEP